MALSLSLSLFLTRVRQVDRERRADVVSLVRSVVRGELTTALDLLSVLSAPTDPPDVDVQSIPLPQQSLTVVPTAVPPRPSADPAVNPLAVLPLATSLGAVKSSASAFFRASEQLIPLDPAEQAAALASMRPAPGDGESGGGGGGRSPPLPARPRQQTRAPDPWPTIMRLHATSPRPLVPLGAMPGATLTGKGETRTARQVGVVYGCPEAREEFRRAAVARVGDLVEEAEALDPAHAATTTTPAAPTTAAKRPSRGRTLVLELETRTGLQKMAWTGDGGHAGADPVERILNDRARSAFAEELFAQVCWSQLFFARFCVYKGPSLGPRMLTVPFPAGLRVQGGPVTASRLDPCHQIRRRHGADAGARLALADQDGESFLLLLAARAICRG